MPKIFISYRRADSRKDAGRIYDRLVPAFGSDNIFMDVDDIPLGDDFRDALIKEINDCDVVLAIIGKEWLSIKDANGNRRLDNSADFVLIEIQAGLDRGEGCRVIPVLVDGATMPSASDLPSVLLELAFKQNTVVRDDPDFHHDVDRLIQRLQKGYNRLAPSLYGPPANYDIYKAIGDFFKLYDERDWEGARTILVEIRASGKSSQVFNIDTHEKALWEAIETEERDAEYGILQLMATRSKSTAIWDALQKFWENFPNYDPDNLARFRSQELVALTNDPSQLDDVLTSISGNEIDSEFRFPVLTEVIRKILPEPFDWCFVTGGKVELETDPHTIYSVTDFLITKYAITNAQFQVFLDAKDGYACEKDYSWYGFSEEAYNYRLLKQDLESTAFDGDDLPRTNVSWFDAVAFSRWLSNRVGRAIRLPTEQQWQRAARGDTKCIYPWGNEHSPSRCNTKEFDIKKPVSVTSYPDGISPYGVFNMSGNVWEWCLTDYDNPGISDAKLLGGKLVARGGSFHNYLNTAACMSRFDFYPNQISASFGFRLVITLGANF